MKEAKTLRTLGLLLLPALILVGCHELIDGPAEFVMFEQSQPLDDFEALEVDLEFDVGTLEIGKASSADLYSIELEYDRLHFDPDLDFDDSGTRATLNFDLDATGGAILGHRMTNDLVVLFNEEVVLDLEVSTGVSETALDLTDLKVRSLRLDGGVGRSDVFFDDVNGEEMRLMDINSGVGDLTIRGLGNARVNEFRLDGGIGRTELDFTGQWEDWSTEAEINVGVGQVKRLIPREVAVEIEADGSFLSSISAPDFERNGNRYTRNMDGPEPRKILIRITSGVGGVTVEIK